MDKRIIKSKKAITTAFVDLLATEDLKNISITDIANAAEVDRKTIYNYYKNVDDILVEIEDSLVDSFQKVIDNIDASILLKNPFKVFEALTDLLHENLDFYLKISKFEANYRLVKKVVDNLKIKLKKAFIEEGIFNENDVGYIANYVVTGMISAYNYWFHSGMKIPLEQFSRSVSRLVCGGTNEMIIKK